MEKLLALAIFQVLFMLVDCADFLLLYPNLYDCPLLGNEHMSFEGWWSGDLFSPPTCHVDLFIRHL